MNYNRFAETNRHRQRKHKVRVGNHCPKYGILLLWATPHFHVFTWGWWEGKYFGLVSPTSLPCWVQQRAILLSLKSYVQLHSHRIWSPSWVDSKQISHEDFCLTNSNDQIPTMQDSVLGAGIQESDAFIFLYVLASELSQISLKRSTYHF